jgi:hypothetical protein
MHFEQVDHLSIDSPSSPSFALVLLSGIYIRRVSSLAGVPLDLKEF